MLKRVFTKPTAQEVEERKKMYKEAASLGIDLMGFDDSDHSSIKRKDRRKAVVLLGTGQSVPKELKERLVKKTSGKRIKKVSR